MLSEQVCFALYSTSLAMNRVYRRLLDNFDLTYPQYLVLLVLWERDDQMVSEITAQLMLDSPTLTPLLKRMQAQDLVVRRRAENDERQVIVSLTAKARELKRRALAIPKGVFCASGCSPEELVVMRDSLVKLRHNLLSNA